MSGDDLRGFIVYSEDRYHAVAVFRKADSKTWTVRCFRRNDFLAWVLKKEETIDMPDAQSDKELWLRAEIWVQDVLDELEAKQAEYRAREVERSRDAYTADAKKRCKSVERLRKAGLL